MPKDFLKMNASKIIDLGVKIINHPMDILNNFIMVHTPNWLRTKNDWVEGFIIMLVSPIFIITFIIGFCFLFVGKIFGGETKNVQIF